MAKDYSGTVPYSAPDTFKIERQGGSSVPYVRRFPQVRGGICEYCGVKDPLVPSEHQYKLCDHYRGMQLRCSYCDATKDQDQVIGHSTMNVASHPNDPTTLIVWCDTYSCSKAHEERSKKF